MYLSLLQYETNQSKTLYDIYISTTNPSTACMDKIQSTLCILYFLLNVKNYCGSANLTEVPSPFIIKNPNQPERVYLKAG